MEMEDITAKVAAATAGKDAKAANDTRKATLTQLEQACEQASAQRQGRPVQVRDRRPVPGRPVLAVQVQALQRRAPRVRARARASPPSAATRTTSSSRAGAWTCRCCAPTGRRQAGRDAELPHASIPTGPKPASWCSSPATRATPIAAAHGGAARRRSAMSDSRAGCCAPPSCAAANPVRQDQHRGPRASSPTRSTTSRTASRCGASSSTRCSMNA